MDPFRIARSLPASVGPVLCLLAGSCLAETIVVTDSHHPVTNAGDARVIELDRAEQLTKALSAGLPTNPQLATISAKKRLSSEEGRRITAELRRAYQDVADARGLRVQKIPAVVVDRSFVVYGLADVAAATELIDAYQKGAN
ncbi:MULTISPECIES: TIGR03757 family integrating conjugative element protein [Pseudomonadaceae]|uniref:TIGR03757 family integrating conjugative element protein n=1 Tax=Pseudomonadaceae TaxID=135621 RepID=UPI0014830342|nr:MULTISPECIES: TIGR03757 family integrating conjugative element protein [Pseudomonadaceae]MDH0214558.1 TIGR03757 family integrating conjugative element protein [Stutzerimonas stutzeri]MDH0261893.1 TIGR03757 family integrating conjugative element protein [Stutzerimonas stutzeri]MDI9730262.1 TIGR03757 family integrating conjugative element protein [Stutzerimonas stutzeri]MDI9750283.1 TIGR03757 family integrating conjugative element protein [Stutzerimonas stutzeri]QPI11894.1 TIGR03757 family in